MPTKTVVLFCIVCLPAVVWADAGQQPQKEGLFKDGMPLGGVDGRLFAGGGGKWFFKFAPDVNELAAGPNEVEILPSAALEKAVADANGRQVDSYRLWGTVTKYSGSNFIFPFYLLPVTEVKDTQQQGTNAGQKGAVSINDPNDELKIPQEIIGRLQKRRIVRPEQLKTLQVKTDSIIVERTARIDWDWPGYPSLIFDAAGRNIETNPGLHLLPCQALELAGQQCRQQPACCRELRFKVAGIITQYKGTLYLLLQRATLVYSHGNFDI